MSIIFLEHLQHSNRGASSLEKKEPRHVFFVDSGKSFPYSTIDSHIFSTLKEEVQQVTLVHPQDLFSEAVISTKPDLLLVFEGLDVLLDQVDRVRRAGIPTAVWLTDDPYYIDHTIPRVHHFDYIFTVELGCVPLYEKLGCTSVYYLPLGACIGEYRPIDGVQSFPQDICFIGTAYEKRIQFFDPILPQLMKYHTIFRGLWWDKSRHFTQYPTRIKPIQLRDWMLPNEMNDLYNTTSIILNKHRSIYDKKMNQNSYEKIQAISPNPRTFEICASGAFQLVDERSDLARFYIPGVEIETYASGPELIEKVEYYLSHEQHRCQIAKCGWARTLKENTYAHRIHTLLGHVFPEHQQVKDVPEKLKLHYANEGNKTMTWMDSSNPKRAFFFSHVCNAESITGAEKLLLHFIREMRAYFMCFLVVPQEGKLSIAAKKEGINILYQAIPLVYEMYAPDEYLSYKVEQLRHMEEYTNLCTVLKKIKPDLIVTNTCVHPMPALVGRELSIPVIWKITEVMQSTPHLNQALQVIDYYSNWVIGISECVLFPLIQAQVATPMSKLYPTWDDRTFCTRDLTGPSRINKREKLGLESHHICIGYIASFIFEAKGLLPFVQMALQLAEQYEHCRFWIIGTPAPKDTSSYDQCMTLINQSPHKYKFLSSFFEQDIHVVYTAMDIVVIPSMVTEGFGMTALEAMLFAKPVVSFAHGGLGELMCLTENDSYAVLVGNVCDLYDAVSYFLDDPQLTQQVGTNNREKVRSLFGPEQYTKRLHAILSMWPNFYEN